MEYTLSMTFLSTAGDKVAMSITGVKPTITQAEVITLMDTIIAKDVFVNKGNALVTKSAAQLIQREVTKFDFA